MTVRASGAHPDVLTIQDAMRQVLDIFEMLEAMPGIEWRLVKASADSPLYVEAEAISMAASVDVSVVARAQKQNFAKNFREITRGRPPVDPTFRTSAAKRVLSRNMNGVGGTDIDLDLGEPISVTPAIAEQAIRVLEQKPTSIFDVPGAREEIGSLEGTLSDVATYYNQPAVRIIESRTKDPLWCRLSEDLQLRFQDKATFVDVWQHRRVIIGGRIKYDIDGEIEAMLAKDIRRIDVPEVSLEAVRDPEFTGGFSRLQKFTNEHATMSKKCCRHHKISDLRS